MPKKVTIIILNYNNFEDTIECFESLQKITYKNYVIVIIDNFSPDNSMDFLIDYMIENKIDSIYYDSPDVAMDDNANTSKITLIQSGDNFGYGHGNNIGIKYGLKNGADYILVLNNDTLVEPKFLEPMVNMCEEDNRIGIASGKIYFHDRPDTIWFNGGKFSSCTAKVEHFNINEKDIGQIPNEPVTFISGCMWLIPKKVFKDVGFINEEYFMYVEDLEFCQRVLQKKYIFNISNDTKIQHKVDSSSGHWSDFFAYWMSRNKMKFIANSEKKLCMYSSYLYHCLYMSMWWILHKRYDLFRAHFKGILSVITHQENSK